MAATRKRHAHRDVAALGLTVAEHRVARSCEERGDHLAQFRATPATTAEPDSRTALEWLVFPEGTVRPWAFDVPIELLAKVSRVTLMLPFPKMASCASMRASVKPGRADQIVFIQLSSSRSASSFLYP